MMSFQPDRVRDNAESADTEDLLDRVTTHREGMDPQAIPILERELHRRGITPADIEAHWQSREAEGVLWDSEGLPARCCRCPRPAVVRVWKWHRLWGRLPLFPRQFAYCHTHKNN